MSSVGKMSIDECVDLFVSDGGVEGESKADQPDNYASNKKHQAALENAKRGWPVLPIHTVDKGRCSCGKPACTSARRHGLSVLDLQPEFVGLSPETLRLTPGDTTHPNSAGHEAIARTIEAYLRASGLLPDA